VSSINLTTLDKAFLIKWGKGAEGLVDLTLDEDPFLRWVPKDSKFGGKSRKIVPRVNGTRGANDYGTAKENVNAPTTVEYTITRGAEYDPISIDCEAIAAAETDPGALEDSMTTGSKCAAYEHGRAMSSMLWGNGKGARGQIKSGSTITGTTLTLRESHYARFFEKDAVVRLASAESYANVRNGKLTVAKVNSETGVITFNEDVDATIPDVTDNDFLFRDGTKRPFLGVFAWIPYADLSESDALYTAFNGVDRTIYTSRLTGTHLDTGGGNIEDALIDLLHKINDNGGRPDSFWMNTQDYGRLEKEMGARAVIDMVQYKDVKMGFPAMKIRTGNGDVAIMSSPDCRRGHGVAMKRSEIVFSMLRTWAHFVDEDKMKWRHEDSEDAVSAMMRTWGNLLVFETHHFGSVKFYSP